MHCYECGEPMMLDENEVSHHLDADGNIDHDADADHVALDDQNFITQ